MARWTSVRKVVTAFASWRVKEERTCFGQRELQLDKLFCATSTIDLETETGADIVIEERDPDEIAAMWYEERMAPEGVKTYNPAFDVTDAKYITAVVTEKGIVYPPFKDGLARIKNETEN